MHTRHSFSAHNAHTLCAGICRPCAESCHKDHAGVKEYIMKHTPTWACCYCVKNHKCKIVHKKPAK